MEYVFISLVLFIIFVLFTLPGEIESPDNLTVKVEFDEMSKKFNVTLSWTPATDATITGQILTVTVNGTAEPAVNLGVTDATHQFQTDEKVKVDVSLVATNGPHQSAPLTASFTVPAFVDLVVPPSPTGLAFKFDVVDVPTA